MPRDISGNPHLSQLAQAAEAIQKRLDNYGQLPVIMHRDLLGRELSPSAHFTVDEDSITQHASLTGDNSMAIIPVNQDLSSLSDEALRVEQDVLNREARRRSAERTRREREREAERNARPSFDKFFFEAQYRGVSGGRAKSPTFGTKTYEYLGMILPDGRVFLTGGKQFTSWARFVDWVNGELRWISRLHKVNVSNKPGPNREFAIPMPFNGVR